MFNDNNLMKFHAKMNNYQWQEVGRYDTSQLLELGLQQGSIYKKQN